MTRRDTARVVAELSVIVIGVLVALAVDRWIADLDTHQLELDYLEQLSDNLQADSAQLDGQLRSRRLRLSYAPVIMAALEGNPPPADSAAVFLRRLDRFAIWTPFSSRRDTWNEIVSTGDQRVLQDASLRRELSAYYSGVEFFEALDADMDSQLTAIEMRTWEVLEPERRLAIVRPRPGTVPEATSDEVWMALDRIRSDRSLYAGYVQVQLMNEVIISVYEGRLESVTQLLGLLAGGAP